MQNCYRHGEILLVEVEFIPKEAKKTKSQVFAKGNTGNSHSIDKGTIFLTTDPIKYAYLQAKDTSLLHPEHSPNVGDAKIEDGCYLLVRQQEYTPKGLIPVID